MCSYCSKEFASSEKLSIHEALHVPIEQRRKFACAECGKLFTSSSVLRVHSRIHSGE